MPHICRYLWFKTNDLKECWACFTVYMTMMIIAHNTAVITNALTVEHRCTHLLLCDILSSSPLLSDDARFGPTIALTAYDALCIAIVGWGVIFPSVKFAYGRCDTSIVLGSRKILTVPLAALFAHFIQKSFHFFLLSYWDNKGEQGTPLTSETD